MKVKNEQGWAAVVEALTPDAQELVDLCEGWADSAETLLESGAPFDVIVEPALFIASDDNPDPFMVGVAVELMSKHWAYGAQLDRWYRKAMALRKSGEAPTYLAHLVAKTSHWLVEWQNLSTPENRPILYGVFTSYDEAAAAARHLVIGHESTGFSVRYEDDGKYLCTMSHPNGDIVLYIRVIRVPGDSMFLVN